MNTRDKPGQDDKDNQDRNLSKGMYEYVGLV